MKLEELVCDGILVSTPAGSTAYNLRPRTDPALGSNVLAMTPISPSPAALARRHPAGHDRGQVRDPRRLQAPGQRHGRLHEVRDVVEVTICESREQTVTLLFDPEHNLEDRILNEQFQS